MKAKIIDLSHHNGGIDFSRLKTAGVEAVILKATQGTKYQDPTFVSRLAKARSAGLEVGAYHFMTDDYPKSQVEHFLGTVNGLGKLLLCLDYEGNGGHSPDAEILEKMVLGVVKAKDRHPVVYGSDGNMLGPYLRSAQAHPEVLACKRWIARYSLLKPKTPCNIWQYTSKAKIAGMGPLDANAFMSQIYPSVSAFWRRWEI